MVKVKFKGRFSKDKKEISLIWIVVGGVIGMGVYMGSFEGKLFENGGDIVKDLGSNGNLLGVVKKGPVSKNEIDMNEGSALPGDEKKRLGNLEFEEKRGFDKREIGEEERVGKNDFKLDETGGKFETPVFNSVLKERFGDHGKINIGEEKRVGIGVNVSGKMHDLKRNKDYIKEACLKANFDGSEIIKTWLVEDKKAEINKRRNIFCTGEKNRVENYLRNKLLKERKTSAVFNGLKQARILMAGHQIYVKFDGLGIYLGKEGYQKGKEKTGWKLSLQALSDLDFSKEEEIKKAGEKVKKVNVESKGEGNKIKILKNKLTGKIYKVISEYENELKEYEDSLKDLSKIIKIQGSDYSGIDNKLKRYRDVVKRKVNEKVADLEQIEEKNIIGEEIDLKEKEFSVVTDEAKNGGLLVDKGKQKVEEKRKRVNDLRNRVEKTTVEKLAMYTAIKVLSERSGKEKNEIKSEILKLNNGNKKYSELYQVKSENLNESEKKGGQFLKVIAILSEGNEKEKYKEIKDFKVEGDLTEFNTIKEAQDFLEKNKNNSEDDYGIPTGEMRIVQKKREVKEMGKKREIKTIYKEQGEGGGMQEIMDTALFGTFLLRK